MAYIITIVTSFGPLLSFNFVNNAFSSAAPLIAIKTGDPTVDKKSAQFLQLHWQSNKIKSAQVWYILIFYTRTYKEGDD